MGQDPAGGEGGARAITSYTPRLREGSGNLQYPAVREYMDRKFVTLHRDQPVHEAIETLLDRGITGAGVVDDDGHLCGVLSEKDCLKVLTQAAYDGLPGSAVRDYMTCDVHTITSETDVLQVVQVFLDNPYRRLLVVDDGKLVGQITRRDMLRAVRTFLKDPRSWTQV